MRNSQNNSNKLELQYCKYQTVFGPYFHVYKLKFGRVIAILFVYTFQSLTATHMKFEVLPPIIIKILEIHIGLFTMVSKRKIDKNGFKSKAKCLFVVVLRKSIIKFDYNRNLIIDWVRVQFKSCQSAIISLTNSPVLHHRIFFLTKEYSGFVKVALNFSNHNTRLPISSVVNMEQLVGIIPAFLIQWLDRKSLYKQIIILKKCLIQQIIMILTNYLYNGSKRLIHFMNKINKSKIIPDFNKGQKLIQFILTFKEQSTKIYWIEWFIFKLAVKLLSVVSTDFIVHSRVLQRSHLGPLLFILFINDFPSIFNSPINVLLFADDAKHNCIKLQINIEKLNEYIAFNIKKCQIKLFYRKREPILSYYRLENSILTWDNLSFSCYINVSASNDFKSQIEFDSYVIYTSCEIRRRLAFTQHHILLESIC
ncbi:putative RNA-directed DNA polymerase [Aphis craccivora]|uniref:Putative RNA-directed DNA polymerase n=1 Tax=Aphis craccivora TaxID=307492 RepID=A0A6G0ZAM1_APHCR|nr:putative RNA-directed DNA polymerase [Aphis craccivora]